MKLDGIYFSKVTDIFYKMEDNQLYKFRVYPKAKHGWEKSDYRDVSNNSKNWKKVTDEKFKAVVKARVEAKDKKEL